MSQQFHHIPGLLKPEELVELERLISALEFVDGKATASMSAQQVKNNLQLDPAQTIQQQAIQQLLNRAIGSSPFFQAAAQPGRIYPFIISKYDIGKYYGWHVDSPIMGDPMMRTDLAMTIFLSDPRTYTGGELVIQTSAGNVAMKPEKGDAILYPCQFLHCVNEVKSGTRMAAITWIQSNVRSSEQRDLLFQLNQVHAMLQQKDPHGQETNILLQSYSNLFRMWAEM